MSDIIQLLPDSVANQIAAGEVIQRPASVIKELVENAVDAGADEIQVIVKDAGRTLIQVIDNGCGMSETDARMSFERHATSKIRAANDLFAIRTMGFRGEALASIAAIAQVELKTKHKDSELGTRIEISGSRIESQEPVSCGTGSNFIIKNLFYNVPARRRFLKTNATELRHIITEFQRVALANPQVAFHLTHNDQPLLNLAAGNLRQRVIGMMGKQMNSQIIPVNTDATILNVTGFIGKPESARKTAGDQYFFVNNRYMRHPYLHKAVMDAYANLIPADAFPAYFLYFDINPEFIDVNIHPTKTEIKFEDEKLVWKVLNASVRESLGKFNIVPSIDFDTEGQIHIPARISANVSQPRITINPDYNPFENNSYHRDVQPVPSNWESLYRDFETGPGSEEEEYDDEPATILLPSRGNEPLQRETKLAGTDDTPSSTSTFFQYKNRYILTPVKSGLMVIDQRRAHERILFEHFINNIKTSKSASQQVLFAETIMLDAADSALLNDIREELNIFGFEIEPDGNCAFKITGVPSEFQNVNNKQMLENILQAYKTGEVDPGKEIKSQLAAIMAHNACMKNAELLTNEEMNTLVGKLFRCEMPHFSPSGKTIISILENDEFEKRFR